ncbi:uncharacterized protein HMPREF1541_03119 [Cyphellophora europaea CBS 101466]|uniref:SHSP domain-containing protein n=1 Tax=Cyphellophora europaea (strain CBS 101466) TaxID=1220924 RepID=W2RZR5_CYPE1|nr:uncharacterized protein HMPREF1541_03119 [Cyphellophora europaea CBS 101466]ETN41184.1 hypothetical protein HMPREF1541_03119 [Cyphellophora europaea CBS 101466]
MADVPLSRVETLPIQNEQAQYSVPYSGYYTPPPFQTFQIPKHHNLSWESARHSISSAFRDSPWGEGNTLKSPHCDVRESKKAYYIDVDLPGLDSKASVVLKWTNATTLFIEAITKRAPLPDGDADAHLVHAGRHVGTYARAFDFPVGVEQDQTKARLGYGVVRITVPKKAVEQKTFKQVDVEHEGH